MAVVIETTVGDFTVDLYVDSRPQACKNFLKLCKMKYYNFCLFHSVQPNFLAQTGDPTGLGSGGESIYGVLYGENVRYFEAEVMPKLKHNKPGLLSMVNCGNNMLGSQFFITLGEELVSLDGTHCVFGEISEGAEIVLKLNEAICDAHHRPYKDIRITHTVILEDPFDDPSGLVAPDMSPEATLERLANGRIAADEEVDETAGMTAAQVEEMKQEREASARATILEIVGDLPDAEMAPPENVLFVCKLNPVTTDDDLEIIFSRFGKVKSCEVIRDKTTGDSLQYAFVEFEDQKSCEEAYLKMDNVLIDDRRIHVDFSQSVAKMRWKGKGRGVIYYDNKDQPKDVRSSSNRDRENSKSRTRRDKEYDEKERRRDRGRDREDDRQGKERGRERDAEDRHRRRDERDRSRSEWRKRDNKHRKDDYKDDEKRYDSKRKDIDSSRRKDDDSKRVSSSASSRKFDDKRVEERRTDDKRADDRKKGKDNRESTSKVNSGSHEFEKNCSVEKQDVRTIEKIEIKDKDKGSKLNSPLPIVPREDNSSDNFLNDSKEMSNGCVDIEKSPEITGLNQVSHEEYKINEIIRGSSKEGKSKDDEVAPKEETGDTGDEKLSQNSEKRRDSIKKSEDKKKNAKRKRKVSESRKRKKRRHSSSSESSSESSDSSESSSSSDSSDHRHGKKKKLIVAKRYYRGGKLVKEIKKKRRTKDTTDSESVTEDSSDTDSRRKSKSKKYKKVMNIVKHHKRKSVQSSDDSQSGSSSSDDSDLKKKKRKIIEKQLKKKHKHVSAKKKKYAKASSSSSDSENSFQNSVSSKSSKKLKKSSKNLKHHVNLLETNSSK